LNHAEMRALDTWRRRRRARRHAFYGLNLVLGFGLGWFLRPAPVPPQPHERLAVGCE
jgi:hypothetical protein